MKAEALEVLKNRRSIRKFKASQRRLRSQSIGARADNGTF
jgi:hypothetical protein